MQVLTLMNDLILILILLLIICGGLISYEISL